MSINAGLLRDLSGSTRGQMALHECEQFCKDIMNYAAFSVLIMGRDGLPTQVNRGHERLWGVGLSSVRGRNILHDVQVIRQGLLPATKRAFAGETSSTPPFEYDLAESLGAGPRLLLQCHNFPIRGRNGRVEKVIQLQINMGEATRPAGAPRSPQSPRGVGVQDPYGGLADREKQILQLIAKGHLNREMAEMLHLSVRTVECYRARLMDKLGIRTAADLTRYAIGKGLVGLGE